MFQTPGFQTTRKCIVQFLPSILQVIPQISKVKLNSLKSIVTYIFITFYQKALSPVTECYGNKLYGVMPPIMVEEQFLCIRKDIQRWWLSNGSKEVGEASGGIFITAPRPLCWYTICITVLGNTGDAVRKRVDEVLLYLSKQLLYMLKIFHRNRRAPFRQYML